MKAFRLSFTARRGARPTRRALAELAEQIAGEVPGVCRAYLDDDAGELLLLSPAPSPTAAELHDAVRALLPTEWAGDVTTSVRE